MKSTILILAAIVAYSSAATTRDDVIKTCAASGATCIGYNEPDATGDADCSKDVSKCNFAFASISKGSSGSNYKVQLVGKGGGWVGLAFSEEEDAIMRADNLGVVCVNTVNPPVQIFQIQDIRPPRGQNKEKKHMQFENSDLANSVSKSKLEINNGWMVCEFELAPTIKHITRTIDLKNKTYKLGLAINAEETVHEPGSEYENSPHYHGPETRGSSAGKLDLFKNI